MELSGIFVYPVKSCAGIELGSVELDRFGPAGDRRWLVVDEAGEFLTQRRYPRMALVCTAVVPGGLQLSCGDARCRVALPGAGAPERRVRVWEDRVSALDAGDTAADWLSAQLGLTCRLVYMPDDCRRLVDGAYAREGETVSFADGFPLLLVSRPSLDELNSRLQQPVPMNRFRPNLVVEGCAPFAEDHWRRIRVGAVEFEVAKPCARCAVPSIDQATAQRDPQINRVLAGFRRYRGQVFFGQNLLYRHVGRLAQGDPVEVLEAGAAEPPL